MSDNMFFIFEIAWLSFLAALLFVLINIVKITNNKQKALIIVLLLLGLFLRLEFSIFAPMHGHDHHVDILNNYRFNYEEQNLMSENLKSKQD